MSRLMQCGLMSWVILCSSAGAWADEAEDKAAAFVKNLGGRVTRERSDGKPVTAVSLFLTKLTDAGLKKLAGLKNLTGLDLGDTKITDAGLKELAGLKNLRRLSFSDTQVTDAGLKELAELKILTSLELSGTKVTDEGVKELKLALPRCRIVK